MSIHQLPVRELMTPFPFRVDVGDDVASVERRMNGLGVRHLPVVEEGRLVGIVSERDVAFAASLRGDPAEISVERIMTRDPYVVGPEMPLASVVRTMADRRIGSVVVVEGDRTVGLLTTTDVMAAMADLLMAYDLRASSEALPSEVRQRLLKDHAVLRKQLDEVDRWAEQVLIGDENAEGSLRRTATDLYRALIQHTYAEEQILIPILADVDSFGPNRVERLKEEHERQRVGLSRALESASDDEGNVGELARSVLELNAELRADISEEESSILNTDLMKDDVLNVSFLG